MEHDGPCEPGNHAGTAVETHTASELPPVNAGGLVALLSSVVETGGRVELDAGTGERANALECALFMRGIKPALYVGISEPSERKRGARRPVLANARDAIQGAFLAMVRHQETAEREPRRELTHAERRRALAELLGDFALAHPEKQLAETTVEELSTWADSRRGA